ncbi:50S ribosomal protein L1 [Candidatus Erwinia haradaeae]|uniref:Large ribosomal subunit protein uL1 n=1 Tax=Candidatus Erwinia haradaeae TaxID=1922217 RepID=A0A451D8D7_9GAMM|nr:50S ribosomal protein L1 [Candidatus Erwinia haradaeae]VFP82077.1 50S ribosomal protein L1 [Candidatus Erwinia haradaeae]
MANLSKRMRKISENIDRTKPYEINEALVLLKKLAVVKFIESVDVAVKLGIDPRKSDQNIRGSTILPYGTGRITRVAVFTQGTNVQAAIEEGAELVGLEDLAAKVKKGEMNFDVVIASSDTMHIVSQLGHILGPRGLMPNLKVGTITDHIREAVRNAKSGQVRYRNDKNGIIHSTIGKINFDIHHLKTNLEYLLISLKKAKPPQSKGMFIKKISISTTMGTCVTLDQASLKDSAN